MLSQVGKAFTLFAGVAVLSRLLPPADFGYVAVGVALVGLGEILRDVGLSTAAVTRPNLSSDERNVLFYASALLGVALASVVALTAPLLATLFSSPQLATVMPILSIVFVMGGLGAQYRADLNRRMRFVPMAITDLCAPLIGVCVAIIMALIGAGFWALVAQPITVSLVTLLSNFVLNPWLPGVPRGFREARGVLAFGAHVSWSQVAGYLSTNVDTLVLGAFASATGVGYYNRAYQITVQPLALLKQPATSIALPVLSRRALDPRALITAAGSGQRLLAYTLLPIGLLIAAMAPAVVELVLGDQWAPVVPMVRALAVAAAVQQVAAVASWIFLASGNGRAVSRFSSLSLAVKTCAVLCTAWAGPVAVSIAVLASVLVLAPMALVWACRVAGGSARQLFAGLLWPVLASVAASGAAFGVDWLVDLPAPLELAVGVGVFAGVGGVLLFVPAVRRDLEEVRAVLLRRST